MKGEEMKIDSTTTEISIVTTMSDLVEKVNQEAADVFYISDTIHIPEKAQIKSCYREDFVLLSYSEVKKLCKENKKVAIPQGYERHGFFVYNERKNELVPFKKNDYLMDKDGYTTFDGKTYFYYDNDGNELGKFT